MQDDASNAYLYYLYAVARPREDASTDIVPLEGIVPRSPVYTLAHRDLLAFVSHVPWYEFDAPVLATRLQDAQWTRTMQLAHRQVLAALLDSHHLVPLTFCSLYHSRERVQELLAEHYDSFDVALRDLTGASEWGVKVFCDHEALEAWLATSDVSLSPLRERIAQAPAGVAYFLHKQLTLTAEKIAGGIVSAYVQVCHERLAACARAAVSNPVQTAQLPGRTIEMIFNGVYLVADNAQNAFHTALVTLEETFDNQCLQFELTGPQPAYHFSSTGQGAVGLSLAAL